MALLFIDSFDHYQTADLFHKWTQGSGEIHVGAGRCGSNCLVMPAANFMGRGINFGSDTVVVGFAFYIQSPGTDADRDFSFMTIENPIGGSGGWMCSLVYFHDGSLALSLALNSGIIGQTRPTLIHWNVWYFLELKMTFHATAGTAELRVNDVAEISLSGISTVPAGFGTTRPSNVGYRSSSFVGEQTYRIDDFYALDSLGPAPWNTFLGDCRVEYLRPRAAGSLQQWTPVGSGGSHWLAVDDNQTPDEDTTYIEANAPGLTDTNLYQPTGLPSGPIYGAQLSLYARKTDIGPRVIAPVVAGVTSPTHYGPSFETYQFHSTPYATNPATGLAWTIAEINAIEAGVTVVT